MLNTANWLVGNHSSTHPDITSLTQAQIETEWNDCAAYLTANGMPHGARHGAYPLNLFDDDVLAADAAAGMLTCRTGSGAFDNSLPLPDPHRIVTRSLSDDISLATAQGWVDDAVAHGTVIGFLCHEVNDSPGSGDWDKDDLEDLIDYCIAYDMPFITPDELYYEHLGTNTTQAIFGGIELKTARPTRSSTASNSARRLRPTATYRSYAGTVGKYNVSEANLIEVSLPILVTASTLYGVREAVDAINAKIDDDAPTLTFNDGSGAIDYELA